MHKILIDKLFSYISEIDIAGWKDFYWQSLAGCLLIVTKYI